MANKIYPECLICTDPITDGSIGGHVKQTRMRNHPLAEVVSTLEWGCPHGNLIHPECYERWVSISPHQHAPKCPVCRSLLRVVSEEATMVTARVTPSEERFCLAMGAFCIGGMSCIVVVMFALQ